MTRAMLVVGMAALVALLPVRLRADVTITQVLTLEGQAVTATGQNVSPKVTVRIKGARARVDVEANDQRLTTLLDQASGQATMLDHAQKTATIASGATPAKPAQAPGRAASNVTVKALGTSRTIDGVACDDYAVTARLRVAELVGTGGQVPPETAAALKDVHMLMNGTSCVVTAGPGVAEYAAFQKGAASVLKTAMNVGMAPGVNSGTLAQILAAVTDVPGLAYVSETNISVEGPGQVAALLQQFGTMKLTTKTTSISIDPLADDLFRVPEGYKVIK